MQTPVNIYQTGDAAITIQWNTEISQSSHGQVMAMFRYFMQHRFTGLLDVVPAYTTLTVHYNAIMVNKATGIQASVWVHQHITNILPLLSTSSSTAGRRLSVPVCYHPSLAPDIETVAQLHHLSINQLIHLHTATTYHVYMLGFLPGFPYMGVVLPSIATPRKASPRKTVPAGSVGIAGNQTGIYPFASPGGWQLIGQTPLQIFNAAKPAPAFFTPGDEVNFYAISIEQYYKFNQP